MNKRIVIAGGLLCCLMLTACGGSNSGLSLSVLLSPQSVTASFDQGTAYMFP